MTQDKILMLITLISVCLYMIFNEYLKTKYKNKIIELLTLLTITRESIKNLVLDEELKKKLLNISNNYYKND